MAKVTIYTVMFCGYCARAKHLLKSKEVEFEEIDVSFSPAKRTEMEVRTGGDSKPPQIWINDQHVGGSDALIALERAGKLDALLAANA